MSILPFGQLRRCYDTQIALVLVFCVRINILRNSECHSQPEPDDVIHISATDGIENCTLIVCNDTKKACPLFSLGSV